MYYLEFSTQSRKNVVVLKSRPDDVLKKDKSKISNDMTGLRSLLSTALLLICSKVCGKGWV